ncbi:MAG: DUF2079 domain-containing protein [Ilumatobacter sp.]|uniref:DUF2079 domain-containing protein n=1 Tax=Ilumatobacter sp. TaxID=1967498 RepID=UPI0032969517
MTVLDRAPEGDEQSVEHAPPRWWHRVTTPQVVIVGLVVLYTTYFTQRSLNIHHALGTASYDSALYDQGVWLISRGETPFVTLMGRNLFGDHTSFVLLLLVPFYWIWPSVGVLFFAQSAAIGAGAIPVFLVGRTRLRSEWLALVPAAAYLVHPAVGHTNLENFHPDAFLGVFVGFAIWAALDRKWKTYLLFLLLALSVKEDASLVLVPLGVWVAVRRDRRIGLATVAGCISFMAFAMFVVMRGLIGVPTRNTWRFPFSRPDDSTVGAAFRVVGKTFTDPKAVWDHFTSDDRPWYLVQMTAPFAWLFVRKPWVAAISALVLFTNILSTFWYQYQIEYHYSLIAVPALSIGTVCAIAAMRDEFSFNAPGVRISILVRPVAVITVGVAALVSSFLWAPVPWGRTPLFYGQPDNDWANAAREIIDLVPDDAVVAAHYRITPHIAHRREIYQFPVPFRSVLYGADGIVDGPRIPARAERVEYVVLPVPGAGPTSFPAEDWTVVRPAFDLVAANVYWALYARNPDVELPT